MGYPKCCLMAYICIFRNHTLKRFDFNRIIRIATVNQNFWGIFLHLDFIFSCIYIFCEHTPFIITGTVKWNSKVNQNCFKILLLRWLTIRVDHPSHDIWLRNVVNSLTICILYTLHIANQYKNWTWSVKARMYT